MRCAGCLFGCGSRGSVGAPCGNRLPSRCGDNAIDALPAPHRRHRCSLLRFSAGGTLPPKAPAARRLAKTLKRVLKNAKTFVRDLSSEVLRARSSGQRGGLRGRRGTRVREPTRCIVLQRAEGRRGGRARRGLEAKRKLIREAKRFQGVWCRACRHKCMDQQATHCRRAACASRRRASSRSATSVPRTFRSRRGNRARRWPIDWRSARRWRAAGHGRTHRGPRRRSAAAAVGHVVSSRPTSLTIAVTGASIN